MPYVVALLIYFVVYGKGVVVESGHPKIHVSQWDSTTSSKYRYHHREGILYFDLLAIIHDSDNNCNCTWTSGFEFLYGFKAYYKDKMLKLLPLGVIERVTYLLY